MDELLSGTLSPGRRYEKLTVGEDLHSVRMSRKYRFVFQILNTDNENRLQLALMTKHTVEQDPWTHRQVHRNRKSSAVQLRERRSGVSGSSVCRRSNTSTPSRVSADGSASGRSTRTCSRPDQQAAASTSNPV